MIGLPPVGRFAAVPDSKCNSSATPTVAELFGFEGKFEMEARPT